MNATLETPVKSQEPSKQASIVAILKEVEEFIRLHDQHELLPLLGSLDDFMTPEELNGMRSAGTVVAL